MKRSIAILALTLGVSAWSVSAKDPGGPKPEGGRRARPEGERGMDGHRPPPPPLLTALDADRDGVIDEKEIEGAAEALKKLDKNRDGKLSGEEIMPPRPGGRGPRDRGPRGERGGEGGPPPPRPPSE